MPLALRELTDRALGPVLLLNLFAIALSVSIEGYAIAWRLLRLLGDGLLLAAVAASVAWSVAHLLVSLDRRSELHQQAGEWVLLAILLAMMAVPAARPYLRLAVVLRQLFVSIRLGSHTRGGNRLAGYFGTHPARLLAGSFLVIIAAGTLMLTFPAATVDHRGAPLLDALFTAVSATCVTGLIVRDTGSYFSLFGQGVILFLIQIGALGIMTLSGSAAVLFGHRLGQRTRSLMAELLEQPDAGTMQRLLYRILLLTLAIEAAGALLLYPLLARSGTSASQTLYASVFHAISAFCNAGFSLWRDSLTAYRGSGTVNAVIGLLIVAGGLGFTVISALVDQGPLPGGGRPGRRRRRRRRLTLHGRLVLLMTSALLLVGAVLYYFVEYHATLRGLPLSEKLLGAGFASVTARTAGFNTVDMAALGSNGLLLLLALMFIGGSPGGTAGGIKTTTAAVLLVSVRAMVAGRDEVEIAGRTIPKAVVYKAVAITVISFLMVLLVFFLLLLTERGRFEALLFEAVSAFGTVGLSMDVTGTLSSAGKLLVTLLMFAGRTGPLTMALALGERRGAGLYKMPNESVMVG